MAALLTLEEAQARVLAQVRPLPTETVPLREAVGRVTAAAVLAVHQQWLIRDRTRAACFKAFLANNRFGAVIFLGLALDYYG